MTTEIISKTVCKCGHLLLQHDIETDDKGCLQPQCPCCRFRPQEKVRDTIKQETQTKSSTICTQSQSRELKTQPVRAEQRDDDGIQAAAEVALRKLDEADAKAKKDYDKIEADDERRKSDIVKDFAKELEGKIATGSIAAEIVHQLVDAEKARHGKSKVSKRLIYKCLDSKYRRQWQKHEDEGQNQDPNQEQSAPVHFEEKKVIPVITSGGRNVQETVPPQQPEENQTAGSKSKQQPATSTSISTPVEQESAATEPQPQEPKPEPEPQEPSYKITILLRWDSLSQQMALAHSPGIKWVQLSGALDDESGKISDLRLTRAEGGV